MRLPTAWMLTAVLAAGVAVARHALLGEPLEEGMDEHTMLKASWKVTKRFKLVTLAAEGGSKVRDIVHFMARFANTEADLPVLEVVQDDDDSGNDTKKILPDLEMHSSGDGGGRDDGSRCIRTGEMEEAFRTPTENEAFIVVVSSPRTASRFFARRGAYHPRAAFLVVVVSEYGAPARHAHPDLYHELFQSLWACLHIFQVLVVDECSPGQEALFAYDPFVPIGNVSRGIVGPVSPEIMSDTNLFQLRDMQGYPIRVAEFTYSIVFDEDADSQNYTNIRDVKFMSLVAHVTKGSLKTVLSNDGQFSGTVYANGTSTGTIQLILNNKADSDYNARPLEYYENNPIEFAYPPIEYDYMVVMIHKAPLIPLLEVLIAAFTLDTWSTYILSIVISIVVCYLSRVLSKRKHDGLWYHVFNFNFNIPDPNIYRMEKSTERLAVSSPMLAAIVLFTIFQAVYFQAVANPRRYKDIGSLQELSESSVSNIFLYALDASQRIFDDPADPVSMRLFKKLKFPDIFELLRGMLDPQNAALIKKSDWLGLVNKLQKQAEMYTVIQESVRMNVLSYITPYGSPFVPIISHVAHRVTESGIATKWYAEYRAQHDNFTKMLVEKVIKTDEYHVALENVKGCFLIFACGIIASAAAFILEVLGHHLIVSKQKKCKKKEYNKGHFIEYGLRYGRVRKMRIM